MTTSNEFFVSVRADSVLILRPPKGPITREQALRLAAYLVALADTGAEAKFPKVLEEVRNA